MKPSDVVADPDGQSVWASIIQDGRPVGRGGGAEFLVNVVGEINLESAAALRQLARRSNRSGYDGSPLARLVDCLLGENPDRLSMGSTLEHAGEAPVCRAGRKNVPARGG
jgi:hypothetical protein